MARVVITPQIIDLERITNAGRFLKLLTDGYLETADNPSGPWRIVRMAAERPPLSVSQSQDKGSA